MTVLWKVPTDNTLKELSAFKDFLCKNFHNYEHYKDMQPDSNQPAYLYGTAKTQKFETLEDINVAKRKFQTIIDQTGTFTYNAAKVISDYLSPYVKWMFHQWYTKTSKHVTFNSTFARWQGRYIIWCWVIICKYSDRRNNQVYHWINSHS